ncbi:hypothetical protein NDU88_009072 [Pleurodeles waltl]|uniref:Uncharacterized protein n=1 Tax=Pleurodeles waltl TaxID=8319 RepID=A0AAV7PR15_PLEWA|nr:hypothetical protein NDU88_009072 [Pleurodeles waltl]
MAAQWMPEALQVVVLAAYRPSPAASDGCPVGLLLLAVVLLVVGHVAVLAAVHVVVLAAVQVAVLAVVVVASRPSPAASDGCPLGLLLLAVVLLVAGHVAVLVAVYVAVLATVWCLFLALAGWLCLLPLAGVRFLPLLGGRPFFTLAGGAGTLARLTGASLEPLTPAVAAETTVAVDWVAEVLDWVLATMARGERSGRGVGNRSIVARKSFLGTLGQKDHEGLGVEEEGVVIEGVSLLCLAAGAWAGCCCDVDVCWVSVCVCLCTLGGGVTVGEDTGDVCMDVGVVTASEGRVVIGVLVMEVVEEDVVHAGVSGDATGREVDEEEEGDTVETVDVGVSACGWCLCECL